MLNHEILKVLLRLVSEWKTKNLTVPLTPKINLCHYIRRHFSDANTVNQNMIFAISFQFIFSSEQEYNCEIHDDLIVAGVKLQLL